MDVRPVLFALFLALFMFTTVSGVSPASERPIVYTREQLLAFRSMEMLTGDRPAVPRKLRRKRRGRHAGAKLRARRRRYRPVLPSITMGNVRSLPNKMDEIVALTRHEREYRESNILPTETWLTELTPDPNATLDGFHLLRADRTRERAVRGKEEGWLCL